MSLCSHKEFQELTAFTGKISSDYGFHLELDGGTALASVKLDTTLSWERDNNVSFRTDNISALMKLQSVFKDAGYSLRERDTDYSTCANNVLCGYVGVKYSNRRLEMLGLNVVTRDLYQRNRTIFVNDSNKYDKFLYSCQLECHNFFSYFFFYLFRCPTSYERAQNTSLHH